MPTVLFFLFALIGIWGGLAQPALAVRLELRGSNPGPNGEVSIWLMNGATLSGGALVGGAPTNWTILASADFNGDGKADILWRGPNGEIALWLLNGANIISGATCKTAQDTPSSGFTQVQLVGPFLSGLTQTQP